MLTVLCFQWFDPNGRYNPLFVYSIDHVTRLHSMMARHLKEPHRFVCVTNERDRFPSWIETYPVDDALMALGHRYPKLITYHPDAAEWFGERILAIDLDVVIVGAVDPLLDQSDFRIWQDPMFGQGRPRRHHIYNTSLVYLHAGARPQLWTEFKGAETVKMVERGVIGGTDQAWVGHCLGPNEKVWTARDGIHGMLRLNRDHRHMGRLPEGTRMVFFAGKMDPSLPRLQRQHPWIQQYWR